MTARGTPSGPVDHRELVAAAENASEALVRFGKLNRQQNAPDDEHTRYQMRAVLDHALEEVFQDDR